MDLPHTHFPSNGNRRWIIREEVFIIALSGRSAASSSSPSVSVTAREAEEAPEEVTLGGLRVDTAGVEEEAGRDGTNLPLLSISGLKVPERIASKTDRRSRSGPATSSRL